MMSAEHKHNTHTAMSTSTTHTCQNQAPLTRVLQARPRDQQLPVLAQLLEVSDEGQEGVEAPQRAEAALRGPVDVVVAVPLQHGTHEVRPARVAVSLSQGGAVPAMNQ